MPTLPDFPHLYLAFQGNFEPSFPSVPHRNADFARLSETGLYGRADRIKIPYRPVFLSRITTSFNSSATPPETCISTRLAVLFIQIKLASHLDYG